MTRRAPHEGTIRQRADGRWESVVHVGWENGRRVRKNFYGRTRREVQQKLVVSLRDLQAAPRGPLQRRLARAPFSARLPLESPDSRSRPGTPPTSLRRSAIAAAWALHAGSHDARMEPIGVPEEAA